MKIRLETVLGTVRMDGPEEALRSIINMEQDIEGMDPEQKYIYTKIRKDPYFFANLSFETINSILRNDLGWECGPVGSATHEIIVERW